MLRKIMDKIWYPDPRIFIVHGHIFKNAGTTLDWALQRNFGKNFLDHRDDEAMRQGGGAYLHKIAKENPSLKAISTHHLRLPLPLMFNTRILPVFLLRHPIDRARSVYLFERKQATDNPSAVQAKKHDFRGYVEWSMTADAAPTIRDIQVRYCSGSMSDDPEMLDAALEKAKGTLDSTLLLGTVDRFQASMVLFEEFLRPYFPTIDLAYVVQNQSQPVSQLSLEEKAQRVMDELGDTAGVLMDNNLRDLELYNHANQLLETRMKLVAGFEGKLKNLQERCRYLETRGSQ